MEINFLVVLLAALVPMVMGFIWYNPKVFGTAWMAAAEMSDDKMKNPPMAKIFILSFVFALMLALSMLPMVIHQFGMFSMVADELQSGDTTSAAAQWFQSSMDAYGNNFRTFKHGAFHGFIAGIFLALPLMGTNALYERKSAKYIFINVGFWTACMTVMGGIICQWGLK
ncbi:MAG: DUF1761 domain-containing protein [Bacteroidetes bacterium]|nr:DUF1761 domain-containing protein [Bacteroidota bacterium]